MVIEIKAPQFPESVADGTVSTWYKQPGDQVARDDLLVDIETDKVVLEVVAPADGVLQTIQKQAGDTVESLQVMAILGEGEQEVLAQPQAVSAAANPVSASVADHASADEPGLSPAVRKRIDELGLSDETVKQIKGSGRNGRLTKSDVEAYSRATQASASLLPPAKAQSPQASAIPSVPVTPGVRGAREQKRVPMTRLRARVAERLMQAKNNTAMLTTFNEVNMNPVMNMRKQYKDAFEKAHGVKLGFMSFFVKAAVEALKKFPEVNASMDANDIVYHGFFDIGVAVSSDRGLVVPIIRDADRKAFAEIESNILDYSAKAKAGKLSLDEMTGGTFTISNGGVFGSLLSTPILNPPQTAILGMHKIQDRPVVVSGEIQILPMMYLALSYDHRMIDGKEAVQFLVAIKDMVEDPSRLLLDL